MMQPTGFWSYTNSDDTNSRGKLSQLRSLLANELQQHIGKAMEVHIFQDVAAIPPGGTWERQICEAVVASSFLIPLITPAFVQSEWCSREVAIFRDRELSLGRDDLVFPIHWLDTDHIDSNSPDDCYDKEILCFLRSRQWIDLRKLRFHSLDSKEIGYKLESTAIAIRDALRRTRAKAAQSESLHRTHSFVEKGSASSAPPSATAPSAAITVDEDLGAAHAAVRLKNYSEAMRLYRQVAVDPRLARKTRNYALINIGNLHENGFGVTQDYSEAMRWFREAANHGEAAAQNHIGWLYKNGEGVEKDYVEAMRWYRIAADNGGDHHTAHGQYQLGVMYENGEGVTRDAKLARILMEKAAAGGDSYAKEWLAKHSK